MSELNVSVEEISPVVRRLRIDVPAARVTKVTEAVYQRLGRSVRIPGYRQGHVPRRIIEKFYADQVRNDVAREVVQSTFPEALESTKISPVAEPTVEPENFKAGESFSYSARVEVRPEVKLEQYKELEVTLTEVKVSDEEVSKQIEELQKAHATLKPVEGREVAEMGDFADVSYELEIEGSNQPPEKSDSGLVRIEAGSFLEGRGEKLAGMKIGESREFTESFSAEFSKQLAGKTAKVQVTLKGIKKEELPTLDDEFAKDARSVDTFAELQTKIREDLETAAKRQQDDEKREAVLDALVEKNPLEVPPALVDSSANRLTQRVLRMLSGNGMSFDGQNPLIEKLKQDAMPRATAEVKRYFLVEAIARAENIEITPDELEKKIESMAAEEGVPAAKISARYSSPQSRMSLYQAVENEKVLALLEASAKVTFVPKEQKAEASAANESGANS